MCPLAERRSFVGTPVPGDRACRFRLVGSNVEVVVFAPQPRRRFPSGKHETTGASDCRGVGGVCSRGNVDAQQASGGLKRSGTRRAMAIGRPVVVWRQSSQADPWVPFWSTWTVPFANGKQSCVSLRIFVSVSLLLLCAETGDNARVDGMKVASVETLELTRYRCSVDSEV